MTILHYQRMITSGLGLALMGALPASAQSTGGTPFEYSLGVGVYSEPDYEGSDDRETSGGILLEISWNDRIRLSTMSGLELSADVFKSDRFTATLGFGYDEGREEADNAALAGLGNIDGRATALGRIEYSFPISGADQELVAGLEIEKDLGGNRDGLQVETSLEYTRAAFRGEGFTSIGANATWADSNYMKSTFGISSAQAASSGVGLAQHTAGAGLKSIGIQASAGYNLSENTMLIGTVDYSKLRGDAADSPLVAGHGSANQLSVGAGLVYSW